MRAIAVDDEIAMLETLEEAVRKSEDISALHAFSTGSAALAHARENPVDVAFLDISMRGTSGLDLAEKLLQLQPECKIVFCTGHEKYAVSAFAIHASGYLLKPITAEAVQKEINHIKGDSNDDKVLTVQCFGNFEVLHNGTALPFRRKKTKELLAVLVDRNGAGVTVKQICAILFPDDTDDVKNAAYLRQLVLDLKNTLKSIGLPDALCHETPFYRLDTKWIRCDYLSYLKTGNPQFFGEYMTQYSWAEQTCAMLQRKQ